MASQCLSFLFLLYASQSRGASWRHTQKKSGVPPSLSLPPCHARALPARHACASRTGVLPHRRRPGRGRQAGILVLGVEQCCGRSCVGGVGVGGDDRGRHAALFHLHRAWPAPVPPGGRPADGGGGGSGAGPAGQAGQGKERERIRKGNDHQRPRSCVLSPPPPGPTNSLSPGTDPNPRPNNPTHAHRNTCAWE